MTTPGNPEKGIEGSNQVSVNRDKCPYAHADSIPCPALLSFYKNDWLKPDENGNVSTKHLDEVLERAGISRMARQALVRIADSTDEIKGSFNLYNLRDSKVDHPGSTGIRDPQVNPDNLQDALLKFGENGRMYAEHFAAAANQARARDPGSRGTLIETIELSALLAVFGRVDEKGRRYLTNEDVKGLWIDGKFPEGWKPRATGEVGLDDLAAGVSINAVHRILLRLGLTSEPSR